jgi:hypothetical protein
VTAWHGCCTPSERTPAKEAIMDDKRSERIQADQEKLERAAEPHDWAEEVVDSAVAGLISPLTHETDTADDEFEQEPERARKEREHDEAQTEERLNEVW